MGASLSTFAAVAALVGCASFSERPALPEYTGPSHPVDALLSVSGSSQLQLTGDRWTEMPASSLPEVAKNAIWNSGWIRSASDSSAAIRMELDVSQYQSSGPGLIPLLTAFVIPGVIDHRINLVLRATSATQKKVACSRSIQCRTWYQTFLIFVYPFRSPAWGRFKSTEALALGCLAEVLEELDVHAGR